MHGVGDVEGLRFRDARFREGGFRDEGAVLAAGGAL